MNELPAPFWSVPVKDALNTLGTNENGLSVRTATERLAQYGENRLAPAGRSAAWVLLAGQFKSPLILILVFATGLSFYLHDPINAAIILAIVLASGLLGFWQERSASNAVQRLLAMVEVKATVIRDGRPADILVAEVVPGDVVMLDAGDIVPGDCLVLASKDLFVDESTLTGESFPVEKSAATCPAATPLNARSNALWMGTHVISGTANALVIATGRQTEFGKISERLKLRPAETEFERGIRGFGYFLMEVTLVLVIAIFAINVYLHRPVIDSFLFSLALAVGLTPQLLPAIISINLAQGAKRMALGKVIVKRLSSIEDFGSMNVICSDKTGTLTEGTVQLQSAVDLAGAPSEKTLLYAYLNAFYETGFTNPIDAAIRQHRQFDTAGYTKLDEIPYDFLRKRLSVLVSHGEGTLLITKGALANVLEVCTMAEVGGTSSVALDSVRDPIQRRFEEFSGAGFRTLGVAYKPLGANTLIDKTQEAGLTFLGFLVLFDPPKPDVVETIAALKRLGVGLKIITGDNRLVARHVSEQLGLPHSSICSGQEIRDMADGALMQRVGDIAVFAEVEPNQKERIILALKKAGNVVGYLGDGINDASALHAADVGISVESAVDVAKEAADIVLLDKDLGILLEGVREGRRTFANTLKYVFMATSANFGNMFSMAGISLVLPFLPLLPKQILLTNLLTDLPEMTIATDSVDDEMVDHPRRWDIKALRSFMMTFGLVSSVFDYLTFGCLLLILHASPAQFRTGWFLESVISASMIVLVIRSQRPFFRSRPGRHLVIATAMTVMVTLVVPFTPAGELFGFVRLPPIFLVWLGLIVVLYIGAAELAKFFLYRPRRT